MSGKWDEYEICCVGYENFVTWYETPCTGYEMPSDGYENEISMKFADNRHWKKVARYEETFF